MPKPFLSFQAQINFLETDKNLLIQDHDYARSMLMQIGYFSYSKMTEDQKQQILNKAHNARSEKEMHDIVNSLVN